MHIILPGGGVQSVSTSFQLDGLTAGIYLVYAAGEQVRFVEKVVVR